MIPAENISNSKPVRFSRLRWLLLFLWLCAAEAIYRYLFYGLGRSVWTVFIPSVVGAATGILLLGCLLGAIFGRRNFFKFSAWAGAIGWAVSRYGDYSSLAQRSYAND